MCKCPVTRLTKRIRANVVEGIGQIPLRQSTFWSEGRLKSIMR